MSLGQFYNLDLYFKRGKIIFKDLPVCFHVVPAEKIHICLKAVLNIKKERKRRKTHWVSSLAQVLTSSFLRPWANNFMSLGLKNKLFIKQKLEIDGL